MLLAPLPNLSSIQPATLPGASIASVGTGPCSRAIPPTCRPAPNELRIEAAPVLDTYTPTHGALLQATNLQERTAIDTARIDAKAFYPSPTSTAPDSQAHNLCGSRPLTGLSPLPDRGACAAHVGPNPLQRVDQIRHLLTRGSLLDLMG